MKSWRIMHEVNGHARNEYQTDRLIPGDCLEVMRDIPDDTFDMSFADPPFNLGKRYSNYKDGRLSDEYVAWCREWIGEMVRVTKPTGSILVHNIPKWLTYYSAILNEMAHFKHWIAWDAMSNPVGKTLLPAHYGVLFYTKQPRDFKFYEVRAPHKRCRACKEYLKDYGGKSDQRHPFGALVSDVWTDIHRIRHNKRRDPHPCQLPIHLMERLILMTTSPGDVVLDPFLGTGTTAIAARALGRYCVGIDIDKEYISIAHGKIDATEQTKEGEFYVSKFLGEIVTVRDVDAKQLFPRQYTSVDKKRDRMNSNGHSEPARVPASRLLDKDGLEGQGDGVGGN